MVLGKLCKHLLFTIDFRFDSSVGRGDLITEIGVGRVIRGTYVQLYTNADHFVWRNLHAFWMEKDGLTDAQAGMRAF